MKRVFIYDSTLRDGAQALGISYTIEDKLKIVEKLDRMGVSYIEAGNPGSNPKDLEFFKRVRNIAFKNAKLISFGSTRRCNVTVEEDESVVSLLAAETDAVAVFGKSWDFQVTDILKTTLDENLNMIYDTVRFFKDKGKEVVYDAEHFFDGYKADRAYAVRTLRAAEDAGADSICLCDTKGGTLPNDIYDITRDIVSQINLPIGIHCHNDIGMAVACSVSAVQAGAVQVQGTMNGLGERSGNANLCSIIPTLQIMLGYSCILEEGLEELTMTARYFSELANIIHDER
ncbi:MAG: citramalate synthase, partial [Clostridiales bacterium]|nr:citramalate synthase [Clostridiales bacterium]